MLNSLIKLEEFQQLLLKDDQSLIGIQNKDPKDIARNAKVSASAETNTGKAEAIIDGWNRSVDEKKTYQWQAPMNGPQWIQLEWQKPQEIKEIQITFDSGLNRKLFLTGQDSEYSKQIRGPQPETVSDYSIEVKINGTFEEIIRVKDNFKRLNGYTIKPVITNSIRIIIHRTNGDKLVRIFQVRCYS